jgi:RHS repeat-associated protein
LYVRPRPSRDSPRFFDAKGNRTRLTWPDGYYVTYTYDALDRMASALENGTFTLATYAYNPLSQRTGLTYRAGMASAYTYTNAGDLTALNINNTNGTLTNYTLGYTHAHELNSENSSVPAYVWQPAATGRDNYTAVNTLNQYPSWTPSGGTRQAFTYDNNGNMTGGNIAGVPWAFTYDDENRLTTACTPACSGGTVDATYAYDPLGRRNEKSGTGVTTTYFLDDGADEIAEYSSTGTATERYVPGPAINEPINKTVVSTGARYYFQTDHHGSVIGIGNSSGAEIEGPFTYDSYGNCFVGTAACSTVNSIPYKFVGMRLDPETGLYYDRARYYSSIVGRFLQPDSVGYTSDLNMYAYSGNDPTNKTDPSGETWADLLTDPQAPSAAAQVLGGVGLIILGGGGDAGSAAAEGASAGVATPLAVPAAIVSTGLITSGAVATAHGASILSNIVNKNAPAGNGGTTETPHGSPEHDAQVNQEVQKMRDQNYTDIRKDQAQVDANGNKVGNNRPDVQGTNPKTGQREHVEVDRDPKRGAKHERDIMRNDPSAKCTLLSCQK